MGWRDGDDYFVDLADSAVLVLSAELSDGSVEPRRRWFGRSRCGNCETKLEPRPTGRRLVGTVRAEIANITDPAEFELNLPELVCASCGVHPPPNVRAIANTAADIYGWIFQLIAGAMPPIAQLGSSNAPSVTYETRRAGTHDCLTAGQ